MRTLHVLLTALTLATPILAASRSTAATADAPGEAIFVAQGCNACHAVPAAGVEKIGDDTVTAPTLAGLADEYKPCSLKRWLERRKNHEGYTHLQYFHGSDEELDLMVGWLLEQ